MKPFEIKLRGLFYELREKDAIFYILDEGLAPDTYKFFNTYFVGQNASITPTQFKVKISRKSAAYLDKAGVAPVLLEDLVGQPVELNAVIKHYNFTSNQKKITGWNMHLKEMHPF